MRFLKPKPQGNAMKSVRITAAGAVFVIGLVNLTLPARACDDRFIKKCEKASEAASAEESAGNASARRSSKRVKLVASRHSRYVHRSRHRAAPRFTARRSERAELAQRAEPRNAQAESPMARRFRGFISAQPIAKNAFETLRKPHAVATDFDAAAILPARGGGVAESAQQSTVEAAPPGAPAAVATTPKQNKLVTKPVGMELASADSKRVVLPDLPPVKATAAQPIAAQTATNDVITVAPTQAVMTETPSAPQPGSFPFHGRVLAI